VNPVFEAPGERLHKLAHGSLHRYATYYMLGQSGLESSVTKAYAGMSFARRGHGACLRAGWYVHAFNAATCAAI